MSQPLLLVHGIESYYGPIAAIRGVSLEVPAGKIVIVLGANGAGKTTILKTIAGLLDPVKGRIVFDGHEIQRRLPNDVVRMGISLVPEGRQVFPLLTVRENLSMGAYLRSDRQGIRADEQLIYDLFPRLKERADLPAGRLSGGEQQMLALSRALMGRPRLLLLDEPSLGLSPLLIKEIYAFIRRMNSEWGMTILLVEQNAHAALAIADFGYVIEVGRIVLGDSAAGLIANRDIREAYLGIKEQGVRGEKRWRRRKVWQ
jgi:branched-chain amino acid transport system ATP-binding protein